jgi:hypothetical protein
MNFGKSAFRALDLVIIAALVALAAALALSA